MDGVDNQTNQQPIVQTPLAGDKKPNFTIDSIIGLVFVVMILISWFWPVASCRYNCGTQVSDLMFLPMVIMGGVAGISFLVRVVKLTQGAKHIILRFFGIIAGIGGGVFIFLVGLISGAIAGLRAHPT